MGIKQRIVWVDYLRAVGLLLVILPHVFGINNYALEMIFACNVPIMVLVSGYVSYQSADCSIKQYYSKRVKSLVVPAYIFFGLYFGIVALVTCTVGFPYSPSDILKTFLFMDGIGYTWVISIFIAIALITPLMGVIVRRVPVSMVVIPVLYVASGLAILFFGLDHIVIKLFMYATGYAVISFIGYAMNANKKHGVFYLILMACAYLASVGITIRIGNNPFAMSTYKYPPTLLYISYGTGIAILLMLVFRKMEEYLRRCPLTGVCVYISKNSFQLYLWHILGLYLTADIANSYLRALLVFAVSMIGTAAYQYLQKGIVWTTGKARK